MSFDVFVKVIADIIGEKCPDKKVKIHKVNKNNGIKCTGITIQSAYEMAPVIYLNEQYEDYTKGKSIEKIAEDVIRFSNTYTVTDSDNIKSMLMNFNKAKDKLYIAVVNKECNQKLLMGVPYLEILDLAAVCYISIDLLNIRQDGMVGKVMVNNEMLNIWGITKDELFKVAKESNRKMMKPKVESIEQMMYELLGQKIDDIHYENDEMYKIMEDEEKDVMLNMLIGELGEITEHIRSEKPSMLYVITYQSKVNGAGILVDEEFMAEVAKKMGRSFYIIPSSVHEILVTVDEEDVDIRTIKETIREVNANEVGEGDFLSNNLYRYNIENGRMEIVER